MEMNISPGLGHFTQWDSMERVDPGTWAEVIVIGIQFETIYGVEDRGQRTDCKEQSNTLMCFKVFLTN